MNPIVAKNLELMMSSKEGGMQSLLASESIGGNAGKWRKCSCAATNFHYDPGTGEIKYFGNSPAIPSEMLKLPSHYFRIAVDYVNSRRYGIVEYAHPREASELARKNLEESVKAYNKAYCSKAGSRVEKRKKNRLKLFWHYKA
ncbi:MAG TPA: hypothetical protein VJ461_03340 [Candidatus Nanoarchaeia archaeon]|nr:hypothetical protein [Candidatus Nanoarchaeia archaeon]